MSGKTPWERWAAGERPASGEERHLFAQWDACSPCAACGHPGTRTDPLVSAEGRLIHVSHALDPKSGFYGAVFQSPLQEAS